MASVETQPAYLHGAFDAFVLALDFDAGLLCDYDKLRQFAEILQLPHLAVLLAYNVSSGGQIISPDDLDAWQRWPGREAWCRLVRKALADYAP